MEGYPPSQPPGTPWRGKDAPNPVESIPRPQVEGAQRLAHLWGWLWGRGTPVPTLPWLLRPVSPCGSAIPNPLWCFRAIPDTQSHPRAAQPRGKATFAHRQPLPRASDMSCLACISSTAISKQTARSRPGTRGPLCHWCHRCHRCALAGERRAESPQQHPGHSRGCAQGAAPGDAWCGLRTCQGGCKAPMPTTGL